MSRIPVLMISAIVAALAAVAAAQGNPTVPAPPATQPSSVQAEALLALLDVERQSRAVYFAILERYRPIHPFGMVLRQERRHEVTLLNALREQNVQVPANSWAGKAIDIPDNPGKARALGAELERKTIAAYDRALELTENSALRSILLTLRDDSQHHLWMFENCERRPAARQRGIGPGGGLGRGGGGGFGPGAGPR